MSVKPQTSSFFAQSSLKLDPPGPSDTWKFLQSLTVDSQPKPVVFPSPSAPQDFPTVNLSDLQDFTLNSFIAAETPSAAVPGPGPQDAFSDELPEFPSFSEVHGSDMDNINIDDFQALLGQSGLRPAEDPGSTWMSFPPSIANLIQSENMKESTADAGQAVLDDLEVLNSIDDDRFMSMFTGSNQVGFLSGHPT